VTFDTPQLRKDRKKDIHVKERRGKRRRQLQDKLQEKRGFWKLIAFFGKPALLEAVTLC
jgi:hypothetical protein